MPRKKSVKRAVQLFIAASTETEEYVAAALPHLTDAQVSRTYDAAIIALYRDFEGLILEVLVGAVNNDTRTLSATTGIDFPRHLSDGVCRYIITGSGYFDFKGRDGLIKRAKQYVPADHYLVTVVSDQRFRECLDRLCALRNLAAHGSHHAKRAALKAVGQKRMGSAGSWLKCQDRFSDMVRALRELATELEASAPY